MASYRQTKRIILLPSRISVSSISTNNHQRPPKTSDTTVRSGTVIPFTLNYIERMGLTRKTGQKGLKTVEIYWKGGMVRFCQGTYYSWILITLYPCSPLTQSELEGPPAEIKPLTGIVSEEAGGLAEHICFIFYITNVFACSSHFQTQCT